MRDITIKLSKFNGKGSGLKNKTANGLEKLGSVVRSTQLSLTKEQSND